MEFVPTFRRSNRDGEVRRGPRRGSGYTVHTIASLILRKLRLPCEFSFSRFVPEVRVLKRDADEAFAVCGLAISPSRLHTGGRD